MRTLTLFCVAALQCVLVLSSDEEWSMFKSKYGKVYKDDEEETLRRAIWTQRTKVIRKHNEAADRGHYSYHMGMNQFGDMTTDEFRKKTKTTFWPLSGNSLHEQNGRLFTATKRVEDLPAEVDWRKKGIVTPVVNQLTCASGYAFAATGSLEGQFALRTGNLTVASMQNIIDCSYKQGKFGCRGGRPDQCFQYVADNNGIDSNASYPYEAVAGACRFNRSDVVGTDIGYADIQSGGELALQQAVDDIGPIANGVDSRLKSFRDYKSGVYDDPNCLTFNVDHGMLVVACGTAKNS